MQPRPLPVPGRDRYLVPPWADSGYPVPIRKSSLQFKIGTTSDQLTVTEIRHLCLPNHSIKITITKE